MKKALAFFTLLLGCVAMFAQSGPTFPYQAVVRNSQNQLIKDSTFAVDVEIYQGATLKYSETQSVTTNANGQFTMSIGGGTVGSGTLNDVADWSVAKFKVTCHLSGGDIVSENAVSPVPYALQAANAIGTISGNFLTSDSAVITTMQSDIATNTTNIAANANDIAALANRVNTFNTNVCDSVSTCVGNAIDAHNFLTSDSAVITTMQSEIAALQAASLDCNDVKNCIADTLNAYTPTTQLCDAVKDCDFSGNTSIANLLQTLSDQIAAQNRVVDSLAHIVDSLSNITPSSPGGGDNTCCSELGARLDSLTHIVDSLSALPHGGGDTPTEVADGQPCPGDPTVSDVGGNTYNTVKIGNQCWMKENLRTNVDGSVYPKKNSSTELTADERVTYGRLYTWTAMMNGEGSSNNVPSGVQGICPTGWHVPSDAEWDTLTHYVYNSANPDYKCSGCSSSVWEQSTKCIAKSLSSTTGWNSSSSDGCYAGNTGAKANATGFAAVPAGYCFLGSSSYFGDEAYFWSATQSGDYLAWCRFLSGNDSYVTRYDANKGSGYSVRCLRDAGIGGGTNPSTPGEVSCEQVMECMADTLSRLNARITSQGETIAAQGAEIETLNGTVTTQGETITAQGETIAAQGNTIDSLAHIVDSLSNLTPVNPDTPTGSFTCGTSKVKDAQNNEYNTVKIGNQCWTKENLKTTSSIGATYYPNNQAATVGTYGLLYDWAAAMQVADAYTTMIAVEDKHQGICPTGWHVPSDAEWDTLTKYVYNSANPDYKCSGCESSVWEQSTKCIAKALSSTTGWNSNTSEGCNAGNKGDKANATGFASVPAGGCFIDRFDDFGDRAYCWSATQYNVSLAWCRGLDGGDSSVYRDYYYEGFGFSVRCLRDAGIGGGDEPSEPSEPDTPVTPTDTFNCGTDKVSDVDGNEYNTVQIGNQCWTKENLKTNTHTYGNVYGVPELVSTYGRYYDWEAAMQVEGANTTNVTVGDNHQGICPTGWHVPSQAEWDTLTKYTFDNYKCDDCEGSWAAGGAVPCIAKALASPLWTGGEPNSCYPNTTDNDKNATGFSALPAGVVFGYEFEDLYRGAGFWSTTQYDNSKAYYHFLTFNEEIIGSVSNIKYISLSVRCLRDAGIGGGEPEEATLPTVTTNSVSNITEATATCGGNVTADGGATVTAHGVCWSTSQNPTTSGSHTTDGSGTGSFTSSITGLTASTTYYVRAYATNSAGTAYGEQRSFTTAAGLCDPYLVGRVASTSSAIDGSDLAETIVEYNTNTDTASLFEFFVRKNNCADCGIKISLEVDMYVVDENSNESLMSNVTDYADLSFASYLDWNYTQWTPADASSISIPGHYESFSGMQQRVNYFNLCYADPDYTCNPISMVSPASMAALPYYGPDYAGVGTPNLGRVHGIKVSSWRQAGTYKFVVRLVRRDDSTAYALTTRDFCTENQLGGHSATLTSLVYDTLTFWVYVDTATNDGQPCPGTPTLTDVDGNTYNTVQIGNQCWMKENMKTTKFADGTEIALGDGVSSTTPYRYYPGGEASNVATFGYLYNWTAAMNEASSTNEVPSGVQGICPDGWHIPSNAEWYQLTDFLSNSEDYVCGNTSAFIAKSLAATTEWATASSSGCLVGSTPLSSNNATGFTALPAGHYSGGYTYFRQNTGFWSSSLKDTNVAYKAYLYYNSCQVEHYDSNIQDGCSIRCLKN